MIGTPCEKWLLEGLTSSQFIYMMNQPQGKSAKLSNKRLANDFFQWHRTKMQKADMIGDDTRVKGNEPDEAAKSWRQKLLDMENELVSDPMKRHSKCMDQVEILVVALCCQSFISNPVSILGGQLCQDPERQPGGSLKTRHSPRLG